MADAYEVLREFWRIQDDGDYSALAPLFADEALLEDPVYGTYRGGEAIAGFMAKMNSEMAKIGASFRLEELAGEGEVAWARWRATTDDGDREGVGIYRVRDGKIVYYRDYMNE